MTMDDLHSPLWRDIEQLQPVAHDGHRYLLVNQAAFSDRMKPIEGLAVFEKHPLLRQEPGACCDTATPFVVRLGDGLSDKAKARALRRLCDDGCYASALSVIDSDLPLHDIANALTARCEAQLPDNFDVLLRYFDTRILASLMSVLTSAQLAAFFSCASQWRYADRNGRLVQAFSTESKVADVFTPPLQFSAAQQNALIQAGEVDAVIDVLTRNKLEPLLDMPYPARHPTVQRQFVTAGQWGLSSTPDLASYCTLALLLGEGFESQAPWDSLLAAVKRGEFNLREAIAEVEKNKSGLA